MNYCYFKGMFKWPVLCSGGNSKNANECRLTELKQDRPGLSWTYTLTNEARNSVERRTSWRISEAILEGIKSGERVLYLDKRSWLMMCWGNCEVNKTR
jgi:hypothetical protein